MGPGLGWQVSRRARDGPKGPATGTYRMRRGCGWNNEANVCRMANRYSVIGYRDDFLGFRVVRMIP